MSTAYRKQNLLILFLLSSVFAFSEQQNQFTYHGFTDAGLHLDGLAQIHSNGLFQLTNTTELQKGHAFYKSLLKLDTNVSFSTSFVFAIYRESHIPHSGHGIAFVISPSMDFTHTVPAEYLGLFNASNNGSPANHIFAVELDTVQNALFGDIDANHVGIDVNGLNSVSSASAMYFSGIRESESSKVWQLPCYTTTGNPTTCTDVFAFGMFMLEVVCGRRPISPHSLEEENLMDWVLQCRENGEILNTIDPRLEGNYISEEMELILRLGLM